MQTNVQTKLAGFLIPLFVIFSSIFLSNCKGHVEIFDITDSVINCSPPYVVYFYPDAEHRRKDLEYTWTFGDGTESHDQEAVHTYTEHGIYDVTLKIRQNEAFDSKTIPLYLTADSTAPEANWDYYLNTDSLWAPAQVFYLNDSEHATSFLWEFGDGTTSDLKLPEYHVFDTEGTYTTTLNAMCADDTSKFWRDMIIKPSPNRIDIYDVTIWMPDAFLGTDVWVEIWYGGHHEEKSGLVNGVAAFPVTINITEPLFYFNGNFNNDLLEFEIWSSVNDGNPEKIFDVSSSELQNNYYPTVIGRDDGYGFAYEALIGYQD